MCLSLAKQLHLSKESRNLEVITLLRNLLYTSPVPVQNKDANNFAGNFAHSRTRPYVERSWLLNTPATFPSPYRYQCRIKMQIILQEILHIQERGRMWTGGDHTCPGHYAPSGPGQKVQPSPVPGISWYIRLHDDIVILYKKVSNSPIPSRDVTNQTLLGRE